MRQECPIMTWLTFGMKVAKINSKGPSLILRSTSFDFIGLGEVNMICVPNPNSMAKGTFANDSDALVIGSSDMVLKKSSWFSCYRSLFLIYLKPFLFFSVESVIHRQANIGQSHVPYVKLWRYFITHAGVHLGWSSRRRPCADPGLGTSPHSCAFSALFFLARKLAKGNCLSANYHQLGFYTDYECNVTGRWQPVLNLHPGKRQIDPQHHLT